MTADLHSALLAAISAREERARAATVGPWTTRTTDRLTLGCRCLGCWETWPDAWVVPEIDTPPGADTSPTMFEHDARFIAAEDPSAVLRQTTRDRRVVERHAPLKSRFFLPPLERCAYEWGDGDGWPVAWSKCPAIVDLAEAYAIDLAELPGVVVAATQTPGDQT